MPNYVENTLAITGPHSELKKFAKQAATENDVLDFTTIVTEPKKLKKAYKKNPMQEVKPVPLSEFPYKYGVEILDWRVEHWGTKWSAVDSELIESDAGLAYAFLTAWNPPLPFVRSASRMFPSLTFSNAYSDFGLDFSGLFIAQNGRTFANWIGEYFDITVLRPHVLGGKSWLEAYSLFS